MKIIQTYYQLTKPGIIYGNLLSMAAGFLLASKGNLNIILFIASLLGIAFVIGSSCVFNNYIDKDIDKHMARTKNRSIVTGEVSSKNAIIYASVLGILGFSILLHFTNLLTVSLGLSGVVFYVIIYGIAKRKTIYSTLIGSISGAMPIIAGYTAVQNRIDTAGIILFLILTFWQMPHFYAISIYRFKDYKEAGIILWPMKKGIKDTKLQILLYIIAYIIATILLFFAGYKGYIYLIAVILLGAFWLHLSIQGFKTDNDPKWAKKLFKFSLIVLLTQCALLAIPFI